MTVSPFEMGGAIAALGFAFGAGRIVETIKNGKHVEVKVCNLLHKTLDEKLTAIANQLEQIRSKVDSSYVAKKH